VVPTSYAAPLSWLISTLGALLRRIDESLGEELEERLLARAEKWEADGEGGERSLLAEVLDEASRVLEEKSQAEARAFRAALGEVYRHSWRRVIRDEERLSALLGKVVAGRG
jgi:hypothetical protein